MYYVDSSSLRHIKYDYRLKLTDKEGLKAFSDITTIEPFDDGIRGQIINAYGGGSPCNLYGSFSNGSNTGSGTGSGGTNTGSGNGTNGSGSNPKPISYPCTLIRWDYDTEYSKSLTSFKIYRLDLNDQSTLNFGANNNSNTNPTYTLVKTIYEAAAVETALNFQSGSTYAYIDENGVKPTKDPITYKVKAIHSDGGTSEWSIEITVQ